MKNILFFFILIVCLTKNIVSQESKVVLFTGNNYENNIQSTKIQNFHKSLSKNYIIRITSKDFMNFIWVTNKNGLVYFNQDNLHEYSFTGEGNSYSIIIEFKVSADSSILYYNEIEIHSSTTINISKVNSNKTIVYKLKRRDGSNLQIDNCYLLFNHLKSKNGLEIIHMYYPTSINQFVIKYNEFPNNGKIIPEWVILGKQDNNQNDFYWFEGKLENNFNDTLFQNDPTTLEHSNFSYYISENQIPANPTPKVIFLPTPHFFQNDTEYNYPFELSIYYQADSSNNLLASQFYNNINLGRNNFDDIYTSPLHIKGGKVFGQIRYGSDLEFTISDTTNTVFGLTPTFWFGKFNNKNDTISLTGAWGAKAQPFGEYNQLFLSQTNDAVPQYPLNLVISDVKSGSIVIDKGLKLPEYNGKVYIDLGYPRDSLDFNVLPGNYNVTVTNSNGFLTGNIPSTVTSKSIFNLESLDKNPPSLNSFQILSTNVISHSLNSNNINKVRFMADDEHEIVQTKLYYKKTMSKDWQPLLLNHNGTYEIAFLPLMETGNYDLKLYLLDEYGNSMEMIQSSAFLYDNVTSVNFDEFPHDFKYQLAVAYPNPFNPTTTIKYTIGDNGFVKIQVFNMLGEKVKTIVSEFKFSGNYSAKFEGNNLPSGVYIYRMEVNNKVLSKKMVLLR